MKRIIGLGVLICTSAAMAENRSLNDELEGIMAQKANTFSRCVQLGELASRVLTGVTEENNEERRLLIEEITQYVERENCSDLVAKINTSRKAAPGISFKAPNSLEAVEAEADNAGGYFAPRKVIGGVGKAIGQAANNVGRAVNQAAEDVGNAGLGGPATVTQVTAFVAGFVANKALDAGWEYTANVGTPRSVANSQAASIAGAIYTYDLSAVGQGWTYGPKLEIGVPVPDRTKEKPARVDPPVDDREFESSLDY